MQDTLAVEMVASGLDLEEHYIPFAGQKSANTYHRNDL